MRTSIITLLVTLTVALVLGGSVVKADFGPFDEVCRNNPNATVCQERETDQSVRGSNSILGKDGIILKAVSILTIAAGVASIIIIIIGGLKFILSSGDSNSINNARDTVLYAVIGLVVAISGQIIIRFVINRL